MSTLFVESEIAEAETAEVVGMFAGPGGISKGLEALGVSEVGVELDRFACSTRRANGHRTIEADVCAINPALFKRASGLTASPPCQAFSTAGSKHGRAHLDSIASAIRSANWGFRPHRDPNVWLALEVGRWWEQMSPTWVMLEQVPQALPLWQAFEDVMRPAGWSTWSGVVNSEDYGVPQKRRRAVLLAHADRQPTRPASLISGSAATMGQALGVPAGRPFFVSTGRNWDKEKGTSQVVDGAVEPAPTITGGSLSQWHLDVDPENPRVAGARMLTVGEALTLQSFPPGYRVAGTRAEQGKQIGNAVPPLLATHMLQELVS